MIAQWIRDILSGFVAGGVDRTLWQTVIFLANVAGKMALRLQQAGTALRAGFSSPGPPPKSSLYLPKAAAPII